MNTNEGLYIEQLALNISDKIFLWIAVKFCCNYALMPC